MKRALVSVSLLFMSTVWGQVRDDGWRYIVLPEAIASAQGEEVSNLTPIDKPVVFRGNSSSDRRSVLFRFNLSGLPLDTSLNSVIYYRGTASGSGSNPLLGAYGIANDWGTTGRNANSPFSNKDRVAMVTLKQNAGISISFPVTAHIQKHMKDSRVSFLIEMDSAPGFSQSVEFSGTPTLAIAKATRCAYHLPELLRPIWKDSKIVNESILPIASSHLDAEGYLAFVPNGKVKLQNYSIDKTYTEGVDYVTLGRTIRLTRDSSIPYFSLAELIHNDPNAKPGVLKSMEGNYLTFSESTFFVDKQLLATYDRLEPWDGPVPKSAKKFLPRTFNLLEGKRSFKLSVFGDSISTGANASGQKSHPPFMPNWIELVCAELNRYYGVSIDCLNPSLGGMTSSWGRAAIDGLVSFERPDLVILSFGMNDGASLPAESFASNVLSMMDSVRKQNPNAEFILGHLRKPLIQVKIHHANNQAK